MIMQEKIGAMSPLGNYLLLVCVSQLYYKAYILYYTSENEYILYYTNGNERNVAYTEVLLVRKLCCT